MSQTAVFADSSFYIALVNLRDLHHGEATAFARLFQGKIYTSEYVLVEVGNWLGNAGDKHVFVELMAELRSDNVTIIAPGGDRLFEIAFYFYAHRLDKDWSFTDCSSFVLMEAIGLTEALTADRHFTQAGFRALLA